ncbi:TPA: type VI secretion system lipoprotein TssJ [Klebsiella michiganensis]|nr:type VI secretion system lipoprotein TssJ [Klebsiella michiganensis]HDX8797094.1 type VI secretion system lipoprotein TssJ [Klebsiella michiganensis]
MRCRRTCLRHSLLRQGATAVCRLPSHHKETDVLRTLLIKQLPLLLLPALLTGCGLTQSVSDGTSSAMKSIFYKQVKTLRLDVTARRELNTDAQENTSLSEPVMVRVYQLKDRKVFDKTVYQQLLTQGDDTPGTEILASRSLVVKPGEDAGLNMPLDEQAQFVAVVALFRAPDMAKNDWKLVLARDDLDPDRPRIIEAGHNRLILQPLKDD